LSANGIPGLVELPDNFVAIYPTAGRLAVAYAACQPSVCFLCQVFQVERIQGALAASLDAVCLAERDGMAIFGGVLVQEKTFRQ